MPALRAEKSRWQLPRITSNTGPTSEIELEIAESTSPEAFCCSSASRVSLNIRAFWIAITACSAKVLSNASCLSENAPLNGRPTQSVPIARPSESIGANTIESVPSVRHPSRDVAGISPDSTSGYATILRSRIAMPDAVLRSTRTGNILLRSS